MKPDTFGRRLRAARLAAGLTLQALAAAVSDRLYPDKTISHQALSQYESDASQPQFRVVCVLADLLGVTVDSLKPRAGPAPRERTV